MDQVVAQERPQGIPRPHRGLARGLFRWGHLEPVLGDGRHAGALVTLV